ncbi:GldG family protein [Akkermansia muciniphila]|nr:GldG family protein [Akkermansia muciniphila]
MSETPDTPAAATEASHPAARKVKRPWMTWIKLFLLFLIVVCLNYVGCHEYYRRDLTEDQRYEISRQSINMLQSPEIQKRKTPVKITFAFLRTTQNYTRMRSLLEEYERYSNGKVKVEYVDPSASRTRPVKSPISTELNSRRTWSSLMPGKIRKKRSRRLKAPRRTPPTCASCPETPS